MEELSSLTNHHRKRNYWRIAWETSRSGAGRQIFSSGFLGQGLQNRAKTVIVSTCMLKTERLH
uniref:Uncharacterized protein n=1 Tax=Anguilla anguilla TaxID=7936 RepID=A0A0E9R1A4_ANGAN